ncbi:MAG: hypothetical protein ACK55I_48185, partial [bacterium]
GEEAWRRLHPGVIVALHDQLQTGLVSHLAGEMPPAAVVEPATALIPAKAEVSGTEDMALTVHALHEPGAAEHEDPLGDAVLVPFPQPAHRQQGQKIVALLHQRRTPLGGDPGIERG